MLESRIMKIPCINFYRAILLAMSLTFISAVWASPLRAGEFEVEFRNNVSSFLNTLDKDQAQACLLPITDTKNRWEMVYTGGKRPGIKISSLTGEQRSAMEKALRMVISKKGWKLAEAVAKQDGEEGLGNYWLTCFGDPRKQGDFAFRIAEHHLTLVHLELEKGEVQEFGPVLLGSNPPEIWKEEERVLINAWKKINDPKVLSKKGEGISSHAMPEGQGMAFSSLNVEGKKAIKAAWTHRLRIFTPAIQQRINKLHTARGGWEKSKLAYYNEVPAKHCADGGRWNFKCALPGMVWDYEGSRGHIHMSLWVKKN